MRDQGLKVWTADLTPGEDQQLARDCRSSSPPPRQNRQLGKVWIDFSNFQQQKKKKKKKRKEKNYISF